MEIIQVVLRLIRGGRSLALSVFCAAVVGAVRLRTSVQPVGTSFAPHLTGATSSVSGWCAPEFCGMRCPT